MKNLFRNICDLMVNEPVFALSMVIFGIPVCKYFNLDFYFWLLLIILFNFGRIK